MDTSKSKQKENKNWEEQEKTKETMMEAKCDNSDEELPDYGSNYMPDEEEIMQRSYILEDKLESSSRISSNAQKIQEKNHDKMKPKKVPDWDDVTSCNSALKIPKFLNNAPLSETIDSPISYFRRFFDKKIVQRIVDETNIYAAQENEEQNFNLSVEEFKQFLGTLLVMSMLKMSNSRLYWKARFFCPMITEAITRDRWEKIKRNLHFNNNENMVSDKHPNYDKLFKIRPFLEHLKEKFHEIPKPQRLCIDEQIISIKNSTSFKQYLPEKHHEWGYKINCLCSSDGIMYDFVILSEKIQALPDLEDASNVVLHLTKSIKENMNHLLYLNKRFTSLPLITTLANKGIYCLGSVSNNEVPGTTFSDDGTFIRNGRGTHQEKSFIDNKVDIRVVKWMDNRSIMLMSSFSSAEPIDKCKRLDGKTKKYVMIPCPTIVKEYNNHMGGVDKMNSLIALFRIHTGSKKYYHKLFFHFLDVAVVNSWLIYRRDCLNLEIPNKDIKTLQEFKYLIAEVLLQSGPPLNAGKRPLKSNLKDILNKKKKLQMKRVIPNDQVRTDGMHHYPVVKSRGRCKNTHCKAVPVYFCSKCNVHLCISKNRNCFLDFHT